MGPIALAHWKVHPKVWIELREFVQAGEFLVAPGTCAYIESIAALMAGDGAFDVTPPLLALDDTRSARAGASLAVTCAGLLLSRSMCRGDGHLPVNLNERLEKCSGRRGEGR
jgi:hypothetical protein